jgi:hypothetical protein
LCASIRAAKSRKASRGSGFGNFASNETETTISCLASQAIPNNSRSSTPPTRQTRWCAASDDLMPGREHTNEMVENVLRHPPSANTLSSRDGRRFTRKKRTLPALPANQGLRSSDGTR